MTPKQQHFVREFLVDLNATQAAIRAGYSKKSARAIGRENLTKPYIKDAILRAQAERAVRTEVDADRVVEALAAMAFSDIRAYFDKDGRVRSVSALDAQAAAALASLETKELPQGAGTVLKLRLWDKLKALELLARHLGMFNDRLRAGGDGQLIIEMVQFGKNAEHG